jgi:hypothetical protein
MRIALVLLLAAACTKTASTDQAKPATATTTASQNHLGDPIAATTPIVALADVVKNPAAYKSKAFVTTGTVTSVCQEMGCWMEIEDGTTHAHIKMAGEKFYVPKTSAGKKARVQGTLVDVAGGDADCAQEAAKQTGGEVAKLQLEATGVELN